MQKLIGLNSLGIERLDSKVLALEQARVLIFQMHEQKAEVLGRVDRQVLELQGTKVYVADQQQADAKLFAKLRKLQLECDTLRNQQVSLESWVEKYLPLKLHH